MKWLTPLEDVPIGQRIAITVVVCLIVLFMLALIGYLSGGWDEAQGEPITASKYDQDIIDLDRLALEESYRERVRHLFGVWMADSRDQPKRFLVGVNNARRAYIDAMTEIDKRERK